MSLKEIITIMEREVVRNASGNDSQKQLSYALILEKWRDKVFEGLVANKRYEIVIKDNLAAYSDEKTELKKTIAEMHTHAQLAASKMATYIADCQYKQQTIERVDAVNAA
jgi:hypothetical protein